MPPKKQEQPKKKKTTVEDKVGFPLFLSPEMALRERRTRWLTLSF